jgi:RNA polymerase sigma-70 factor (ECF subfamily)
MNVSQEILSKSDEEIAKLVQGGDKEIFGVLVDRYEKKLLRYGRKFLARGEDIEDIVQDVFVSTYKNMRGFDASQKFSSWIYRIAHNAFVNGLKRGERAPLLVDFDTFLAHPVYDDPSESEREQEEMRKHIDACLDKLPAKYREVLILHYFEDLPYKDIADVLQVPTGTVGIRLRRAKDGLKKVMDKMKQTNE